MKNVFYARLLFKSISLNVIWPKLKKKFFTFSFFIPLFLVLCFGITSKVKAQDILVAEYKFETDQQGWTWQAYTNLGATTSNPSAGWISTVNWAANGGTAGVIRHNVSTIAGSWFARSPGLTFTAGNQYYVKFGATLAGYTASTNQRVQVRIGTSTTPNGGTIVLGSTSIPSTAVGAANYVEFTSPNYTAASTATYYVALADFYSNGSGFACYFDGVRIYQVNAGGPTITTGTISPTTYCAGASVSVPFTITGTFNAGNTFTAQLSSSGGAFPGTNIGTLSGTTAGTISATIPSNATAGSSYRIRVVADNPSTIGADNGVNLTVNAIPSCATTPSPATSASGQSPSTTLSWAATSGATGYDVYFGTPTASLVSTNQSGTTYNPGTLSISTTYQWYVVPRNSCGSASGCSSSPWSFTTAYPSFKTVASGNWNDIATWEYSIDGGSSFNPAIAVPVYNNSESILIRNGHVITVTADATVDQVTFDNTANSTIIVNSGVNLTVNDGIGNDIDFASNTNARLTVNGTLTNQGQINGSTTSIMSVSSTGTYIHALDGGTIPTATWDAASNLNITGMTATTPSGFTQTFGNVTWNCSAQSATASFLNSNNPVNIQGTFLVQNCNGLNLIDFTGINRTWTGDLTITGGRVSIMRGNSIFTSSLTVNNFTINDNSNTTSRFFVNNNGSSTTASSGTLNVNGNLTVNPLSNLLSAISMTVLNTTPVQTGIINLAGNLIMTNGTLTGGGGTAVTQINFINSGTKTFTKTGGSITNIDFAVNSPAILDMGTSVLDNTGTFTLNSGAGIITANTNGTGALTASGSNGSIQSSSTRTYSGGASYTFNGAATQVTGNGLPSALTGNLTINNASGVTLSQSTTLNGASSVLALTAGHLILGANNLTLGSTTTVSGTFSSAAMVKLDGTTSGGQLIKTYPASAATDFTFPIGTGSVYAGVRINMTNGATARNIGIRVVEAAEPNIGSTPNYIHRYWTFTDNNYATDTYTYTAYFNYSGAVITGTESILNLNRWDGTSAYTEDATSSAGSNLLTSTANLSSATWALANSATASTYTFTGLDTSSSALIYTVKFCMQGYYLGSGKMSPLLNLLYPATHLSTDVDTVTVELHNSSSPYNTLYTYTGIVKNDGNIVCDFQSAPAGNYYIVLKHRNSLETWSASAVAISTGNTYDFTTGAGQAYGSMVNLGSSVYGIYSGDVNQDGAINGTDKYAIQNVLSAFIVGNYDANDVTGDGFVDEDDYSIIQNNAPLNNSVQHP